MSPQGLCSDSNVLPGQFGTVGTTIVQFIKLYFEPELKYTHIKSVMKFTFPDAELIWKCVNLELLRKYIVCLHSGL